MASTQPQPPARRRGGLAANLALSAGTFLVLFAVAELVTRLFFPVANLGTVIRFDPDTGWGLRPGAHLHVLDHDRNLNYHIRINSQGVRDRRFDEHPPPGKERILFVGDSVTFGTGVERGGRFSDFVSRATAKHFDAVNAGVPGWGTDQELIWYELNGARLDADVVVLTFFMSNDILNNALDRLFLGTAPKPRFRIVDGDLVSPGRVVAPPRTLKWRFWHLARSSQLLVHFKRLIDSTRPQANQPPRRAFPQGFGKDGPHEPYSHWTVFEKETAPEIEEAWRTTAALIERFARECRWNGAELYVFAMPLMEADDDWRTWLLEHSGVPHGDLDFAAPFARLRRICEAAGVPLCYPLEEFRSEAPRRELFLRREGHPSMAGHALAARCILEWLQDERGIEYEIARDDLPLLLPSAAGGGTH